MKVYEKHTGNTAAIYSDKYLKFLVSELKPYIDGHYKVTSTPDATFVMGSSMGGLISMYAIAEYSNVFGGAACLSTHWPGNSRDGHDNPVPAAFFNYVEQYFPAPGKNKIYFDHGTETLDASYAPRQLKVDELLRKKGYDASNWLTRTFKGAEHSELAWSARLDIPLQFLLAK
jgi:enterochelin esterase-like enzyme